MAVVFATLLVSVAGSAGEARAAGDGKSAALANELRALSATHAQALVKPQQKARVKTAKAASAGQAKATKKSKKGSTSKLVAKTSKAKVAAKDLPKKKRKGGTKVASVSAFVSGAPVKKSLIKKGGKLKGNVSWNAPSGCVPGALKGVLYQVSQKFGPVVVNSTARGHKHNRRVGGARKSWHLRCMAVDFRVHGRTGGLWAYLRSHPAVGGLHRYPSGFFHIDVGPRRTW
ncbi:MAG: D-Ala-D-Ala carboxypeptidase family metallohydrolase [Hyphomicrobiaceae bacterium]